MFHIYHLVPRWSTVTNFIRFISPTLALSLRSRRFLLVLEELHSIQKYIAKRVRIEYIETVEEQDEFYGKSNAFLFWHFLFLSLFIFVNLWKHVCHVPRKLRQVPRLLAHFDQPTNIWMRFWMNWEKVSKWSQIFEWVFECIEKRYRNVFAKCDIESTLKSDFTKNYFIEIFRTNQSSLNFIKINDPSNWTHFFNMFQA